MASARPIAEFSEFTPPPDISVAEVEPGDTLEGLLRGLGFENEMLTEIILGFSAEFDPDFVHPGQRIEVVWSDRAARVPERLVLSLGEEVIELQISEPYRADGHEPDGLSEAEMTERAVSVAVETTVVAAIEQAGAPMGLGIDLAAALGGLVDFRREIKGGEPVEVLYRQEVLPDGEPVGRAEIRYARIDIDGRMFEVVSEGESGMPAQIFENGEPVRTSAAPVTGARVSSHFGSRKHPVLGVVRMHTGVDYAAKEGTPVYASAPGTVTFVGTRGGYGKVIDIEHGGDLMTRYAHLSSYADGIEVGQRVQAGEQIGAVGMTGLATGPHLHYEVRHAGRPVDPLTDARVAALAAPVTETLADTVLTGLRDALVRALEG